jgi:hypothetical protein
MTVAIVAGALANKPDNGGEAWVRLSWLLGLQRLGFDVYFVEELSAERCVDESGREIDFAASVNRGYFEKVVQAFGLEGKASLLCGDEAIGLDPKELQELFVDAELLVNISGHLRRDEFLAAPRERVYVDLDPGFTQAWHADREIPFAIDAHDHYVTVGLNVGKPTCSIPDCGLRWISTLPPVVLGEWPPQAPPGRPLRFTTVATWRSPYGPVIIDGETMKLKHHEFRRMIELSRCVAGTSFEIALDIQPADSADLETLRENDWRILESRPRAGSPFRFRKYVQDSGAEFSVAQGVYTETRSGWFSDRSAAYLASGRPVLVQDTGIGDRLPVGRGVLTFGSLEGAVAGAKAIAADYEAHSAAAHSFAEEHLDSDRVLGRLLSTIGIGE